MQKLLQTLRHVPYSSNCVFLPCVVLSFALLSTSSACLDPLTDDEVALSGAILPEGSTVADAHEDPLVEAKISDNDGVGSLVPLLSGFADGQAIQYWDFGETVEFAIPFYIVVERDGDNNLVRTGHHAIIDRIPGDQGYSPYWRVFYLEVTAAYQGEIMPSFAAVDEAIGLGLVGEPTNPGVVVNCPVVASDVRLAVGGAGGPVSPPSLFYWNGRTVKYYNFGPQNVDGARLVVNEMYTLRREGREALSEPRRGVDITGDGDLWDTNDIFLSSIGASDYSPLVRVNNVAVPLATNSIDSAPLEVDFTTSEDLFNPGPDPVNVV
ncbi:MAG: hypothetical protein JKY56_00870, partial [Kofleriaceae bacterium]|nr:hypothetical protein [Kofleriaceae bacterium]